MIVVETFLKELFSQIPDALIDGKTYPVNFHWGSQDDLNLFLTQKTGNKYPLIWLVQDKAKHYQGELHRRIKLIIAKSSQHKTSLNPTVWETEFVNVLDPLLQNVIKCFQQSGITFIVDRQYDVYREANYTETDGDNAKTIDHWNVIIFESDIIFYEQPTCIQRINFNF